MNVKTIGVLLAAGSGRRMKESREKQFLMLGDKPILCHSLDTFENSLAIDEVVIVAKEEQKSFIKKEIVEKYSYTKVSRIVSGGNERYESVFEGLKACREVLGDMQGYVFIHDSARPFVDTAMIGRALTCVMQDKACVVGVPSKDTVKISDENNYIKDTPNRESVWIIQTPQVFEFELVYNAYQKILAQEVEGITDDAMVVERMENVPVKLVEGSYRNIKITTPEDLIIGEAFLKNR
ncbi:2-C-methyl-D-erythritol 4-phosphate cytidylyltransferase [Aequitasia blattaphilus]|uniref:2-C-methyl-D-erythritol 4-phosphate cytidylyltransferase n=1 Tax=Aequitasia blattaphilus TaxID=2949332 RepID=A0ABT1EEI4_9FIRM|nr:2-C-methyl-D-erythritol 4-phosphate cytidylyltransferase [Aequitasia blattaphilus]MCP1103251.1 2-C-methyl-D-erythritol 4-phosphate cytidylyltransferase [Aequitasia blattaphilus]MCR8615891.1 2-C-methyl-D-erythritol 4-phosphate cytidylyltransferase [Aequitasia blattaphilus]